MRVVERRVLSLMGRLERTPAGHQVVADDRRVRHRIAVARDSLSGAGHGDNVVVKIVEWPSAGRPMLGVVEKKQCFRQMTLGCSMARISCSSRFL